MNTVVWIFQNVFKIQQPFTDLPTMYKYNIPPGQYYYLYCLQETDILRG